MHVCVYPSTEVHRCTLSTKPQDRTEYPNRIVLRPSSATYIRFCVKLKPNQWCISIDSYGSLPGVCYSVQDC